MYIVKYVLYVICIYLCMQVRLWMGMDVDFNINWVDAIWMQYLIFCFVSGYNNQSDCLSGFVIMIR